MKNRELACRSFFHSGLLSMIFMLFVFPCISQSQIQNGKLSPLLLQKINSGTAEQKFPVIISSLVQDKNMARLKYGADVERKDSVGDISFYILKITGSELSMILTDSNVIFVEDASRKPVEEMQIQNMDLSLNRISQVHQKYPLVNGENLVVSIKENKPDTTDIDFQGRYVSTYFSSQVTSSHATGMATMIAGGGNSWYLGKGAAWGSLISSSDFTNLLPDGNGYQQYNISVQNHSYGTGIENYYGADAAAYDASTISSPALLHVFSAGNSGTSASTTGIYSGISGFANLTGSFKMAKNIITAGATDSFGVAELLSSRGPAYDGRIKPELVAFGEDGSSGAAALVSGVSLLLQHQYKTLTGSLPPNSLTKAILINSADDAGNAGPDYIFGFGSLNADQAMNTLMNGRYGSGMVTQGSSQSFNLTLPAGLKKVRVTLTWNDPPASPNAPKALVNDLDLELVELVSGQITRPWVLSHFPHHDSLNKPAVRKQDSLNNTEHLTIENPSPGNYQIRVLGINMDSQSQAFHFAYQFDSTGIFEWIIPTFGKLISPTATHLIRWQSSLSDASGVLEYSTDNGSNWLLIQQTIDLSAGYYNWITPTLTGTIIFRMTANGQSFISDTFIMAPRLISGVGLNCTDSFLLYWKKLPGFNTYRIYSLGNRYLESVFTGTDSFTVLSKSLNPSLHYAVAPVFGNSEGMKSYTFNYTTQGVGCYFRSFLVSLQDQYTELELSLGTVYNIQKIVIEKNGLSGFEEIHQVTDISGLDFSFSDRNLTKGINSYRVKLELSAGQVIYSTIESVYYFPDREFIVFPNPAEQNQTIQILSEDPLIPTKLKVFNSGGQQVMEIQITETITTIQAAKLSKGLYVFRFSRQGEKDVTMKMLIR